MLRKVYISEIVGPTNRGRPLGGLKDRVKEYVRERRYYKGRV